jgi:preprotein translocase subunit SecA
VEEVGGLHIVGSERHESRRIDRQLRGRAGRQGDPGASQFFLSLEDDLMRLFGTDRIAKLMDRMGAQEGEVLTHPLITRSIEQAQKRVELQNFQSRKRLLDYDDVMNQQREVIYSQRAFALEGGEELKGEARKFIERAVSHRVETALAEYDSPEHWDLELLSQDLLLQYMLTVPAFASAEPPTSVAEAQAAAVDAVLVAFAHKLDSLDAVRDTDGRGFSDRLLSLITLNVIDEKWKDHLYDLDQLRASIHYRSWGQKDPLVEYKQEAFTMFEDLMQDLAHTFTERFLKAQLMFEQPAAPPPTTTTTARQFNALGIAEEASTTDSVAPGSVAPVVGASPTPKVVGAGAVRSLDPVAPGGTDFGSVGRNDPCGCGSGKKFKKCHGVNA